MEDKTEDEWNGIWTGNRLNKKIGGENMIRPNDVFEDEEEEEVVR